MRTHTRVRAASPCVRWLACLPICSQLPHLFLQAADGASEGVLVDLDGVNDTLGLVGVAQRRHGLFHEAHARPFILFYFSVNFAEKKNARRQASTK